jgi:hypothetical protein
MAGLKRLIRFNSEKVKTAILNGLWGCLTQFWKGTTQGPYQSILVWFGSAVSEGKI